MAAQALIDLTDDFSSELSVWGHYSGGIQPGYPSQASIADNQLTIVGDTTYPNIIAQSSYDLTGKAFVVKLDQFPTGGTGLTGYVDLVRVANGNDYFEFEFWDDGAGAHTILCTEYENNVLQSSDVARAYDSTAHAWLRMHETAGTFYWEASPDGLTWTTLYSKTWVLADVTVRPQIGSGVNTGTQTLPIKISHLDLPPLAGEEGSTLVDELNRLANGGTYPSRNAYLEEVGAANEWAGTSGLGLLGALNTKADNSQAEWLGLWAVCNQLAGTTDKSPADALRTLVS